MKILERVFVLQKRYNDMVIRQASRMSEKQRQNFQATFAKVEAELTQELHKLSINPRTVERMASPIKEMAIRCWRSTRRSPSSSGASATASTT